MVYWALVFILGLLSSTLVVLFLKYRNSKQQRDILVYQMEEQARIQVYKTGQAVANERKRIGQSLHDDFAGTIAGTLQFLNARLHKETNDTEKRRYKWIIDELEMSYERARNQSKVYFQGVSDNFLEELTDRVKLFFVGSDTRFDIFFETVSGTVPEEVKTALFFILKEAVTNIIKHAGADKAVIILYEESDSLFLEIKDNGNGISPKRVDGNIGLKSIKERATGLGGQYKLFQGTGEGTTLEITIPLR